MSSRLRTDRGGQSVAFIEFNSSTNADRAMAELHVRACQPLLAHHLQLTSAAAAVRAISSTQLTRG
jgi:hypothetical protein